MKFPKIFNRPQCRILKAISPKLSNTVIQYMKQAKLERPVEPHYSYVALNTHVF